jgi:hypothetical protein
MNIANISYVLCAFVLMFQICEGIFSYSFLVYGAKEVTNKLLIWLVIYVGFLGMIIVSRGVFILLYSFFIYFFGDDIYSILVSITLLCFYGWKVMSGHK